MKHAARINGTAHYQISSTYTCVLALLNRTGLYNVWVHSTKPLHVLMIESQSQMAEINVLRKQLIHITPGVVVEIYWYYSRI